MDAIFQQASFDDKNDLKRIEETVKEVEQRAREMPGYRYGECSRCGWKGQGFSRVLDGQFICVKCLIKEALDGND